MILEDRRRRTTAQDLLFQAHGCSRIEAPTISATHTTTIDESSDRSRVTAPLHPSSQMLPPSPASLNQVIPITSAGDLKRCIRTQETPNTTYQPKATATDLVFSKFSDENKAWAGLGSQTWTNRPWTCSCSISRTITEILHGATGAARTPRHHLRPCPFEPNYCENDTALKSLQANNT